MIRAVGFVLSLLLLPSAAFSQTAAPPLAFESADVHISPKARNAFLRGPLSRGGRYELRMATMVDLVAIAYGIDADRVLGGPSWLEMERFDVIAKPPAKSTPEPLKLMLQQLLSDRFKLVLHKDTRPMPVFVLSAGKHSALKKASGSGPDGCNFTVDPPSPQAAGPGAVRPMLLFTCRNMTMK